MVLRRKTPNFHIFEKMKIGKKLKKFFSKKVCLQLLIIETTLMVLIFYCCFSSY